MLINALVCGGMRIYAKPDRHRIASRTFAYICTTLEGKMCNVPVRGKPRPFHYCPYSRFALDGILLCEAGGGRCGPDGRHA